MTVDPVSLAKEALELHLFVREPRLVLIIRPPLDVGRGEAGFEFLVCQRLEGRAVVWIYIGHKGNRIYLSFNVVHIRFQVGGGGKDRHRPDDKRRRQKQGDDRDFSRFHNGCDPFFHRVFAEMIAERGKTAPCFLHTDQNFRIRGSRPAAKMVDNGFIAG